MSDRKTAILPNVRLEPDRLAWYQEAVEVYRKQRPFASLADFVRESLDEGAAKLTGKEWVP